MKKIVVEEKIEIPGTNILLEAGDVVLYKEDAEEELRRLGVTEKEINFLLQRCHENVLEHASIIAKKSHGMRFKISYVGSNEVELYDSPREVKVTILDRDIIVDGKKKRVFLV